MHHPRFSSGEEHGSTPTLEPLWEALSGEELYLTLSQLGATTSLRSAHTLCGVHSSATYAASQPVAWRKSCRSPCHASASISLPATLAVLVNWLTFLLRWPQRALANG